MMDVELTLTCDTAELQVDLARIADGELALPTVSAVKLRVDGVFDEEMPIYLEDDDAHA